MCFVLPDQCFQTGISDWHFLSEDKSDENFLSENTSVKKNCQKIQIKMCQRCFLSSNPLTTYFSLKSDYIWHSYNLKMVVWISHNQCLQRISALRLFKCQKPIKCFVLPDQCFQTGIADWHFLPEDKSDKTFLSENTSVKIKLPENTDQTVSTMFSFCSSLDFTWQVKD